MTDAVIHAGEACHGGCRRKLPKPRTREKLLACPRVEVRIGAYPTAPDAISIGRNQNWLSALDIVKDIESIHQETGGFS